MPGFASCSHDTAVVYGRVWLVSPEERAAVAVVRDVARCVPRKPIVWRLDRVFHSWSVADRLYLLPCVTFGHQVSPSGAVRLHQRMPAAAS